MSTEKPSAVFLTREQINEIQSELLDRVGNVLDGNPSLVNLSVLIQILFVVAEDCGMDADKLLDTVAVSAHFYFNDLTEGTKQ
jgi:hypothetical protein